MYWDDESGEIFCLECRVRDEEGRRGGDERVKKGAGKGGEMKGIVKGNKFVGSKMKTEIKTKGAEGGR